MVALEGAAECRAGDLRQLLRGPLQAPEEGLSAACGSGECVSIAPSNPARPIASAAGDPKVDHHLPGRQPNDGKSAAEPTGGYQLKKPIDWVI